MVIESKISIRKSHISCLQLSSFARIVYFTKSFYFLCIRCSRKFLITDGIGQISGNIRRNIIFLKKTQ